MTNHVAHEIAIVGGGPIGLACAWLLGERGIGTVVYDAGEPAAAWRVAAGMLSPMSEADYGQGAWLRLAQDAFREYENDLSRLRAVTGVDPEFRRCDTLAVALDANERAALLRRHSLLSDELGMEVDWLDAADCRRVEPCVSPRTLAGLRMRDDAHVDPRRLVESLGVAAADAGARLEQARVTSVAADDGCVRVGFEDGAVRTVEGAVLSAGAWTAMIEGPSAELPVRPVRGQILRLSDGAGPGQMVHNGTRYVFRRDGGEIVLGATVEEQGFNRSALAGETRELLEDGVRVVPALREYAFTEAGVGMRPATPDNMPIVGSLAPGLHVATGHFRTGILLAFLTARAICDCIEGSAPPDEFAGLSPARYMVTGVVH